ncbi:MAG: cupin domain-containing protein [Chloroflexia bacterium]|nr:cupin domain-containing protein [Chloroflexia bacterium]
MTTADTAATTAAPIETHAIAEVETARQASGQAYRQFVNRGTLSAGLYVLEAGATDPQQPHIEDEVYYVLSGRGRITVEGEARPVAAGDLVFVAAMAEHRFHDIAETLSLLVFFAPEHAVSG